MDNNSAAVMSALAGFYLIFALIMVAVFAIFGTLRLIMMKQLGVGLGLAVLIDATVIRGVLLPASMKLLGEWNWYMPHWLGWVPSLTPEDEAQSAPRLALPPRTPTATSAVGSRATSRTGTPGSAALRRGPRRRGTPTTGTPEA